MSEKSQTFNRAEAQREKAGYWYYLPKGICPGVPEIAGETYIGEYLAHFVGLRPS